MHNLPGSIEIYDFIVEAKLKENEKISTCKAIYETVADSRNKHINMGTVIRFIKNKNIMKNGMLF